MHTYHALIFALLIKALRPRVKLIFTLHNKVGIGYKEAYYSNETSEVSGRSFDDRSRFEFNTEKVVVIPSYLHEVFWQCGDRR